ncbi:hypothetical protein E4T43_02600 [Aureobasidium subglaciale]|nr:hypothetical protein E4T43_02600 [Aureobasidium subglaciale]
MAPSRAVFRSVSTALAALRSSAPATRTLASSASRQLHHLSLPRPAATHTLPTFATSPPPRRWNSSEAAGESAVEAPDYLDEKELHIFTKLKAELDPTKLEVQDVSGGCGSMYALDIVSAKFKGLSVIKQHRLVNAVLKDEIKGWHGVQLKTKAP